MSALEPDAVEGPPITGAPVDGRAEAARFYREAIVKLYGAVGADAGKCRSCGRAIWWVVTKAGKRAPYTVDGTNHFADCANANSHRRAR
jgi:hypothetical protein